jgi:peptide/nickel transport system permease protein
MSALAPAQSPRRIALRKISRSRLALPGLLIVLIFVVCGAFAPLIAPYDPYKTDLMDVLMPPSPEHWFGTDELGRDLLSRILYGARISLAEGLLSVAMAMAIGVPIGLVSGYAGGSVDAVMMRIIDVLLAFPGVLLAIVIISILGPGLTNAIIAVAVYTVPIFARLARASTLVTKDEPYVEAARAAGISDLRILTRHIFPNISATLFVMMTLRIAIAILTAASLSFLGLGAQAPLPEWGAMLSNSRNAMLIAPHVAIFPGLAIILLVFGLNLFQDGLRQVLDPKLQDR